MHTDKNYTDPLAIEIIELHRFFEDWFSGSCENSDDVFSQRLLGRMDDDFYIVLPGGIGLLGSEFWPDFKTLYGTNSEFKISIRNVQQRSYSQDNLVIVTYEEWQMNAKYSEPPNNGRVSTGIMIKDESTPNGLRWAHVHETWLPQEQVEAEAFDW